MKPKGFTLIELLLFVAIFAIVMVSFIAIFVTVVRVQSRQFASTEVTTESGFVLQQLQYYIQKSSLIDMVADTATTTLQLRMAATSTDPTVITLSGGTLYIQQGSGAQQALTSNKVVVSGLSFVKHSNPPAHDSVSISFTMAFNTANVTQSFAQSLQTAIARVNAASFDSNLVPSSSAIYNLGVTGQVWSSVNNVIYFSGSNVGIGISVPKKALEVSNGDIYIDTAGNNLIMRSPDGTCWWIHPANTTGAYTASSSTCP